MTLWKAITAGVSLALGGDREGGGRSVIICWHEAAEGDHAQRCVIAHSLADLQPDLADEVLRDEGALVPHQHVAHDDLAAIGIDTASGLAPSLHLNLGDGYLRQGRLDDAKQQLDAGLGARGAISDDGDGALIRDGLAGRAQRIFVDEAQASQ
ncbi:MAG: hypothetical protein ABIU87_04135 [Ornithinibacter sp.]